MITIPIRFQYYNNPRRRRNNSAILSINVKKNIRTNIIIISYFIIIIVRHATTSKTGIKTHVSAGGKPVNAVFIFYFFLQSVYTRITTLTR